MKMSMRRKSGKLLVCLLALMFAFSGMAAYAGVKSKLLTLEEETTFPNSRIFTPGNNLFGSESLGNYLVQIWTSTTSFTGTVTLSETSNTIQYADTSSGNVTYSVPQATNAVDKLLLCKKISPFNSMIINRSGGDTFEGSSTSITLTGNNEWVLLASDSAYDTWRIIARSYTPSQIGAQASDTTLDAFAAYNTSGAIFQTAADTFVGRSFAVGSSKLTISNAAGFSGNPTYDLGDITGSTGIVAQTGSGTYTNRSVAVGSSKLTISNGNMVSGNASLDLGDITGSTGIVVQTGSGSYTNRQVSAGSSKISVSNGTMVSGNASVDLGSVASTDLSDTATIARTNAANNYTASQLPNAVNTYDFGSTSKWWRDIFFGTSGTNYVKITAAPTGNRTFTIVDMNSNSVVPSSGSPGQYATGIGSDGVITYGTPGGSSYTATAGEAITAGQLINIYDDSGTTKIRKADNTTSGKEAVGYAPASISNGGSGSVILSSGIITGLSSLTRGSKYFLGTGGNVTLTAPTSSGSMVQYVGIAVSTTELAFVIVPGVKRA